MILKKKKIEEEINYLKSENLKNKNKIKKLEENNMKIEKEKNKKIKQNKNN